MMRKLIVFNQVSLDGFVADAKGDMSWAHKSDPQWIEYVSGNAGQEAELCFGRVTYDQMASFWPTPAAAQAMPAVAKGMNEARKVVFSRRLRSADWQNTRVVGDAAEGMKKLKEEQGPDLVLMGSASICAAVADLVDVWILAVNPLFLGEGKRQLTSKLPLHLVESRPFENGNVVLKYCAS
jgi:dihydrofolate reductase